MEREISDHQIRRVLLGCLQNCAGRDARLLEELNRLAKHRGDTVFAALLNLLTQLEYEGGEARRLWGEILLHKNGMEKRLGRGINLVTALCDYLMEVQKSFQSPKIVELQAYEQVSHFSRNDALTGLSNRAFFEEALAAEVGRTRRYGGEFSLVFFDFDDFKSINDRHGHLCGDFVLKEVARLILEEKRSEDVAARYGGEELVLILAETPKTQARLKAERIRRKVEESVFLYEGMEVRVTVSAGVATFPLDSAEHREILECADRALYRAKRRGKNNVCLFSSEQRGAVRQEHGGLVEVQELGQRVRSYPSYGRLRDLSVTGLLYETLEPMEPGTRIQVELPLPSGEPAIRVLGEVRRVRPVDEIYEIGVRFLEVKGPERAAIQRVLTQHLGQVTFAF